MKRQSVDADYSIQSGMDIEAFGGCNLRDQFCQWFVISFACVSLNLDCRKNVLK